MGLFEILIVAVVTLLVVGPERMPEAVRSVALAVGRLKRALQSAKSEIEEHIGTDEIRRQLHNEDVMAKVEATREKMESTESQRAGQTGSQQDKYDPYTLSPVKPAIADSIKSSTTDPSS